MAGPLALQQALPAHLERLLNSSGNKSECKVPYCTLGSRRAGDRPMV